MEKGFLLMTKVKSMRENFKQTIKAVMELRSIQMVMFISVISKKIKNMVKVNFIGILFLHPLKKTPFMYNIMMEDGGVDFLMGQALTKNQQAIFMMDNLKMG